MLASLPGISGSQRAASCNPLCAIFEAANLDHVRTCILEETAWPRLFDVYMNHFNASKAKSMKQVLTVLTKFVVNLGTKEQAANLQNFALTRILDVLTCRKSLQHVKGALQALHHFIGHGCVSVNQILLHHISSPIVAFHIGGAKPSQEWALEDLLRRIFGWLTASSLAQSAGYLVSSLYRGFVNENRRITPPLWANPLQENLRACPGAILHYREYIFPALFTINLADYYAFLQSLGLQNLFTYSYDQSENNSSGENEAENIELLFLALEVGKEMGLVKETSIKREMEASKSILIR
jgi:hypothetical protein